MMPRPPRPALRILPALALLLASAAGLRAQPAPYSWTISASNTDPFVNTVAATGTLATYYLWLECCNLPDPLEDGMAAAEFDVVSTGGLLHVATIMQNGFLNAGGTVNLLLAVGGCPCGPVVAASFLVIDKGGGGTMELDPSAANGNKVVVDCSAAPEVWAMNWTGIGVGQPPPSKGDGCVTSLPGACCLPDGTCLEGTTFSECNALGGTFQGDGTDCSGGCPVTAGACCFEDGTCQQVDDAETCAALGGVFQGAGSDCSGGCPSFAGACCLPDGTCIITTGPQECAAQGGVFQGTGTDCSVVCPVLTGACCFEDGSCQVLLEADCASLGGFFQGEGTDCSVGCPVLIGACCFEDGSCQILLEAECKSLGGLFQGQDTDCSGGCPSFAGACCFEDGSCVIAENASACADLGGLFQGIGTDCLGECPSFAGACCFSDGSCVIAQGPDDCAAQGGSFLGIGTDCGTCPSFVGACCFNGAPCQLLTASDCAALGGSFRGVGSSCAYCDVKGFAAAAWTISASNTDPFVNSVSGATGSLAERYLWLLCADFPSPIPDGIAAAEFDILSTGMTHVATIMQNGFLNAGGVSNLLLAVGACPGGPVVAANLLVIDLPGSMCIVPSGNGNKVVVDCTFNPQVWSFHWTGFNNVGQTPCAKGTDCGISTNLEHKSWGAIKALYR